MQVDLSKNFFDLFALNQAFAVDMVTLDERFQALQTQLHPDKFAAGTDSDSISIDDETDTQMSPMFLMEQMEYRESLEMAPGAKDPFAALDTVRKQLNVASKEQIDDFEAAAQKGDWAQGRTVVRQWQFLDKLKREVRSVEEQLDD